jgi:hypothetical protein
MLGAGVHVVQELARKTHRGGLNTAVQELVSIAT